MALPRWMIPWLAVASLGGAEPEPVADIDAAWDRIQVLDFRDARVRFEELAADVAAREARLGWAASLLSDAPITSARVDQAEALLAGLFAGDEGDDIAVMARYLHARIPQVHRGVNALAADAREQALAEERYRALYARHPDHPVAQLGATKLAQMRLRGVRVVVEEVRARAAEFEAMLPRLTDPNARRQMHLVLANGYLNERVDLPRALPHLLAAEEMGIELLSKRLSVRTQIIAVAQILGETEVLRRYLRVFVEQHPRDNRTYLFRQMLRDLEGGRP